MWLDAVSPKSAHANSSCSAPHNCETLQIDQQCCLLLLLQRTSGFSENVIPIIGQNSASCNLFPSTPQHARFHFFAPAAGSARTLEQYWYSASLQVHSNLVCVCRTQAEAVLHDRGTWPPNTNLWWICYVCSWLLALVSLCGRLLHLWFTCLSIQV